MEEKDFIFLDQSNLIDDNEMMTVWRFIFLHAKNKKRFF